MVRTANIQPSGCSAVWLARLPWAQEVGGSNPPSPTSEAGSARAAVNDRDESRYKVGGWRAIAGRENPTSPSLTQILIAHDAERRQD